ncbi:MAG: flagellar L-ring protein precursor FlgH, partial [Planctomycetota bacterium]
TAIVIDVLPNGNMVLQGRREIRVDNETKLIEFSGMIRSYDVLPNNTIESQLVAEAKISYQGTGDLTNSTNRTGVGRFLHSVISWFWPF